MITATQSAEIISKALENNGISALLGAIVGSIVGYLFNVLLEEKKSKERYWIQRKNTIYSPVYKELLLVQEYLNSTKSEFNPSIDIEFDEDRYTSGIRFSIWNAIKKDVRYDYMPADIKKTLDAFVDLVKKHELLSSIINHKVKELSKKEAEKIVSLLNPPKPGHQSNSTIFIQPLQEYLFPNESNDRDIDNLKRYLTHHFNKEGLVKMDNIIKNIVKKAGKIRKYKEMIKNRKKITANIDNNVNLLRKLIRDIINNYEGGFKL